MTREEESPDQDLAKLLKRFDPGAEVAPDRVHNAMAAVLRELERSPAAAPPRRRAPLALLAGWLIPDAFAPRLALSLACALVLGVAVGASVPVAARATSSHSVVDLTHPITMAGF